MSEVFRYSGRVYVRPMGRGICLVDRENWPHLESDIPEIEDGAYYLVDITFGRKLSPEEVAALLP